MKKLSKFLLCIILTAALCYGGIYAYNRVQKSIYPIKYQDYVSEYAKQYHVEEALIYAVIKCESSFEPEAVSAVGAKGLMQITPDTFDWLKSKTGEHHYDADDLHDPQVNIRYGTYLLSLNLEQFEDEKVALAAYHAGRGIVQSWLQNSEYSADGKTLDSIPYKDTSHYVERVISVHETYTNLYYKETE